MPRDLGAAGVVREGNCAVVECVLTEDWVGVGVESGLTVADRFAEVVGANNGEMLAGGLGLADEIGVLIKVEDGVRITSVNMKIKTSKTKILDPYSHLLLPLFPRFIS